MKTLEDKLITGYQIRDDNTFAGEYKFPNNLDTEEVYLPYNTTLVKPPKTKETQVAVWNPKVEAWTLKEVVPPIEIEPEECTIPVLPVFDKDGIAIQG